MDMEARNDNSTSQDFRIVKRLHPAGEEDAECDFVIKVGSKEIFVHRCILMEKSDYFNAMLSHDVKENQSGVVEIEGMEFEFVKQCVDSIYGEEIVLALDRCEKLFYAASRLQITTLCAKIQTYMRNQLDPKSFFHIRRISEAFSLKDLCDACDNYALRKLNYVVKELEFSEIDAEYLSFLIKSKKSSHPRREDFKLTMILRWVKADVENRQEYLVELMKLVDLAKISQSCRKYIAKNEEVCWKSKTCMQMLRLTGANRLLLLGRLDIKAKLPEILFESSPNAIIVADETSWHLQLYTPSTGSWVQAHDFPSAWSKGFMLDVVYSGTSLYALFPDKTMFELDMRKRQSKLEQRKHMLEYHRPPVFGSSTVAYENYIYVCCRNSMERYSISRGEWEILSFPSIGPLVGYDGFIYCVGSFWGSSTYEYNYAKQVRKLSPTTLQSTAVKSMNTGKIFPSLAEYDNKLFVVAGSSSSDNESSALYDVEYFDGETDTWTMLAPKHNAYRLGRLCAIDDNLYAVGMQDKKFVIEIYDKMRDSWEKIEENDSIHTTLTAPTYGAVKFPLF